MATFQPNHDRLPDEELNKLIEGLGDHPELQPAEAEDLYLSLIGDAGEIGEECLLLALEVRDRRMAERLYGDEATT